MSELRLNVITGEWVIIAPGRAARPSDFRRDVNKPPEPEYSAECPFCPGNEALTTEASFALPADAGSEWLTRVVANKFPALVDQGRTPKRHLDGLKVAVEAHGVHEVIVETPRHDTNLALLSVDQVAAVIETYRARYRALMARSDLAHIIIFKNHGTSAGTSLIHPHSQLIATPVVSNQVELRLSIFKVYLKHHSSGLICAMIDEELADGRRLLHDSPHFLSFIPYAALSTFHTWIFPKRHRASFGDIDDDELIDLAAHLRQVLRMFYFGLNDPDYNYVIRSSPGTRGDGTFHWYISIIPRVGKAAGFELGSGMFINSAYPEDSAAFLRGARLP